MERKRSLIVAGVVSGTLLAASTAYALSGGLLDRPADDGAGRLAPVTATADGGAATLAPPAVRAPDARSSTVQGRGSDDRDDRDDQQYRHDLERDEDDDLVGRDYEGADDDD